MSTMKPMRVDEAIEAILIRGKELLEQATYDGELLSGATIVRGDRARSSSAGSNSVWFVPDIANVDGQTHGLAELWNLQIIVGAIIKNDDPDEGFMEATGLAGRAQQVLLGRNRRWELPFVEHVSPVRFDPSSPRTSNAKRSLFWADAVVNVRFRRLEPK